MSGLDVFIDALEESSNVKITDREGFASALRGIASNESEDEEMDDGEEKGKGKGMPGLMMVLGKPEKK